MNELRLRVVLHDLLPFYFLPFLGLLVPKLKVQLPGGRMVLAHGICLILGDSCPRDRWLDDITGRESLRLIHSIAAIADVRLMMLVQVRLFVIGQYGLALQELVMRLEMQV